MLHTGMHKKPAPASKGGVVSGGAPLWVSVGASPRFGRIFFNHLVLKKIQCATILPENIH